MGRKRNPLKDAIAERYGLTAIQRAKLTPQKIQQLAACGDDAAGRLLLGIRSAA